ncbi:hypothetical protein ACWD4J_08205 [Streptomyces sp. NPDC002577]
MLLGLEGLLGRGLLVGHLHEPGGEKLLCRLYEPTSGRILVPGVARQAAG